MFSCSVCQELITVNSHVSGLCCGHVYHEICVSTWLQNNNTCPQCRAKLKNKPIRLYFNIDESDAELSPLNWEVKYRAAASKLETIQESYNSIDTLYKAEVDKSRSLRKEVLNLESKVQETTSGMHSLKMQLTQRDRQLAEVMPELEKLRKEHLDFKGLDTVLNDSSSNVSKLLAQTARTPTSFRQLCTYIEVLKQQIDKSKKKQKELSDEIQILNNENKHLKRNSQTMRVPNMSRSSSPSVGLRPFKTPVSPKAPNLLIRPLTPVNEDAAAKSTEKNEVKPAVNYNNLGARPKEVSSSRSFYIMVKPSVGATKRKPVVYTGLGGSTLVPLATSTPRDELQAIVQAKRAKIEQKQKGGLWK